MFQQAFATFSHQKKGAIMTLKRFTLSLATLASLSLLVACSTKGQTTSAPQTSTSSEVITSQVSESTTASATNATTVNMDGTYKGQDEGDSITLDVTGNTGDVDRSGSGWSTGS